MTPALESFQQDLIEAFGAGRIRVNEPLSRHCNWKTGGPADFVLVARLESEIVRAVVLAGRHHQRVTVLGFGANSLVSDRGIRGLVILNRAERIVFHDDCLVEVDSGTSLAALAKRAAEEGVGGLEFLIGIPGTVGAAVAGNAGTRERWIEAVLERVRVLGVDGEEHDLPLPELAFSYRDSRVKRSGEIVLTVWLRGQRDERADIRRRMDELLRLRRSQPPGLSAGSVFKNPPGDFAGRLIEACGLKGHRIGGAEISEMHANFIVNEAGGSAADIKALIDLIKVTVERRFGITLEEEIRYMGDWS
jgi:UDP-N-acetylmuramate dehydrogenase